MHLLNEEDRRLLHALQIAPRVSWVDAARILRRSPATLATRWERLTSAGYAWVAAYPGGLYRDITMALVEVDSRPGQREPLVAAVCADPRAITVEESTRGRDLLLTVMTRDLEGLSRFVLDDLTTMPGFERQRTYLVTAVHRDGSHWRLDALEPQEVTTLQALEAATRYNPQIRPPQDPGPLIAGLAVDGRRTAAELAQHTGRDPSTVRRQIRRLRMSGVLSLRCEISQTLSGSPISCTWMARVNPGDLDRTVTALKTLPELRLCASTTGDTNLVITVWTRDLADLLRIERLIGELLPWVELNESGVNLRTPKRVGWLLDTHSNSTGTVVPPDALATWRC